MDKKFLYETHLHTKEGSACAKNTAREMVYAYKEAGYTGIFVTDHFCHGNCAVNRDCSWEDFVEGYCKGYENAKAAGDEVGLQVFFGWEESHRGMDFVICGLDKEWLLKHPEIREITVEDQYKLIHGAGGLVVHAHPYREASYIPEVVLYPDWIDGVEVYNASHYQWNVPEGDCRSIYDIKAEEYAAKYNKLRSGGSDAHSTNILYGGVAFDRRMEDVHDYIASFLRGEATPIDYVKIRDGK